MGRLAAFFALLFMLLPVAAQDVPVKPPPAPVRVVKTTYFGVDIADPYRYMEKSGDPAVKAWIDAQARYARSVLDHIAGRTNLLAELKTIHQSEPARISSVVARPEHLYFYLKQEPGQASYSLYGRIGLSGKEVLLADPNAGLSAGMADSAIAFFAPSFDGRYVAYAVTDDATGNTTLHFLDAANGQLLPDVISGIGLPVAAWLPDGHSVLYDRIEKAAVGAAGHSAYDSSRIYLHRLGTDPSSDVPVFDGRVAAKIRAAVRGAPLIETAPGSNYVVAALKESSNGSLILYAAPLAQVGAPAIHWRRIGNDNVTILDYRLRGNELFLLTNGSQGPVVARVPLRDPRLDNWGLMLQLASNQTVTGMQTLKDAVYLTARRAGRTSLIRVPYRSSGEIVRANLPSQANVKLYQGDPRVDGPLVMLSSPTRAPAIYRYDTKTGTVVRTDLWPAGPYDDPADLTSTYQIALGSDGTMVPLTIVYKKGLERDGTHPTLLVASGAHSIPFGSSFQPSWNVWFSRGGVLAFAHYTSPTRFQDFITCARYLVDQGYTTPVHLAGIGGGNGAIIVGRAITTDPHLFRAAVIESGLLDPLAISDGPGGVMGEPGLGNTETLEGFRRLQSFSSYQHVEPKVRYPAVLLEAGANDVQVPMWQSAKMAAKLDADSSSGLPVLLSIHAGSARSLAASPAQQRALFADEVSFLFWQLGEPGFQPPVSTTSATR